MEPSREHQMNQFRAKGSGKFISKKQAVARGLGNAKPTAKRPILSSSGQNVEGQPGQYGPTMTKKSGVVSRAASQTVALMPAQLQAERVGGGGTPPMPPFSPNTPEQWMRMAAQRSWDKFPERAASVGLRPPPYPTSADEFGPFNDPTGPTHDQTAVSAARVMQYLLARFNPIRGLTPQRLGEYLEQWSLGFLRWLALSWSMIRERDDQIKGVVTKREFAVSKLQWEILTVDDSEDAKAHKLALTDFYNGLSCTHVLDQNENGGVQLLIRQMMRSIGDKFAVHEIVWKPGGEKLTAQFRFVPLWFFENRTGQLRYLPYELALDGIPLDAGGWLVTVGDGLNFATSIAYIYKQLALKDWARYSEKFGIPMILGKTPAAFNSTEWNQLVEALAAFNSDGAMVVNKLAEITPFEVGRAGEMPQVALCDRMDRAIARLWRGGDLSTMSRGGDAAGALTQIQAEDEIAEADSILLSEALNFYVDRYVIKYKFGVDTPLASFKIIPPRTLDNNMEIATDTFLIQSGVEIGKQDLARRYDRPITLAPGDEPADIPMLQQMAGGADNGQQDPAAGGNRKTAKAGRLNGKHGASNGATTGTRT